MSQQETNTIFTFGFIGLGPVSRIIFHRLADMFPTDVDFILYDRDRTEIQGAQNVTIARSPLEVVEKSIVVFVRYFDPKLVYRAFFEREGILQLPTLFGKGIVELSNLKHFQQNFIKTFVHYKKGKYLCANIEGNIIDIIQRSAKFTFSGLPEFYRVLSPIISCFTDCHEFTESVVHQRNSD